MNNQPTTYTNPVARFPVGSESDSDTELLARLFHARSTCVGISYEELSPESREAIRGGVAHVVNAIGEAIREKFGQGTHAELRGLIDASFAGGDNRQILRHAEDALGGAIRDDEEFRARVSDAATAAAS